MTTALALSQRHASPGKTNRVKSATTTLNPRGYRPGLFIFQFPQMTKIHHKNSVILIFFRSCLNSCAAVLPKEKNEQLNQKIQFPTVLCRERACLDAPTFQCIQLAMQLHSNCIKTLSGSFCRYTVETSH